MDTLNITRADIEAGAKKLGKDPIKVEQAVHLLHILEQLGNNNDTLGKFALRGGTALNLFHGELPRVSKDIDLDYIGAPDSEQCNRDRETIPTIITDMLTRIGYQNIEVPHGRDNKWSMQYESVFGGMQALEMDINYFDRVPSYEHATQMSASIASYYVRFPILNVNDLMAGKFNALMKRGKVASRDVYDIYRMRAHGFDPFTPEFRVAFMTEIAGHFQEAAFSEGAFKDRFKQHLNKLSYGNFLNDMRNNLSQTAFEELSYGNLTKERFEQIKSEVSDVVMRLLTFNEDERRFVHNIVNYGDIKPQLILSPRIVKAKREELTERIKNNSRLNYVCKAREHAGFSVHGAHTEVKPTAKLHPIQKIAEEMGIDDIEVSDCKLIQREAKIVARRQQMEHGDAIKYCITNIEQIRTEEALQNPRYAR